MSEREEQFEKMLQAILRQYEDTVRKMDDLSAQEKTKSATYRQLLGNKLTLSNILSIYKTYGLIGDEIP